MNKAGCMCIYATTCVFNNLFLFQISRLLVTDPQIRISASEALDHPFLQKQPVTFRVFSAKRKFKVHEIILFSKKIMDDFCHPSPTQSQIYALSLSLLSGTCVLHLELFGI